MHREKLAENMIGIILNEIMKPRFHYFLALVFLLEALCEANVLEHLKIIENKTEGHTIRNIDFIYLINLDQRPEKFQMCVNQLIPYGIIPFRFSAIYGWNLDLDTINDVGVKYARGMDRGFMSTTYLLEGNLEPYHERISVPGRTYFCHCLSRGAIGIILSHLSVLMDAYKSGYETIWVMEDDIDVVDNPHIIPDFIDELDQKVGRHGWDILFTDRDYRSGEGKYVPAAGYARRPNFKPRYPARLYVNKKVSQNLRTLGARFGATSMIIRRSGMKKILDFYKRYNAYHPYDMDYHVPVGMKMFTVLNDVVTNKVDAISDNGIHAFKEEEK